MTKHWESTLNTPPTCPKDGVHFRVQRNMLPKLPSDCFSVEEISVPESLDPIVHSRVEDHIATIPKL